VVHKSNGLPITPQVTSDSSSPTDHPDFFGSEVDPTDLTYMFSLRIYDDTACADAIIFGKVRNDEHLLEFLIETQQEGEHFFQGLPAEQFLSDHRIRSELISYLKKIIAEETIFELNLMTYLTPASALEIPAR
jgi:hypothetical protein